MNRARTGIVAVRNDEFRNHVISLDSPVPGPDLAFKSNYSLSVYMKINIYTS
jgi:hypothetical protein